MILDVHGTKGYDGHSYFTQHISKMFQSYYCQFLQKALWHVVNNHPNPSFFWALRRRYYVSRVVSRV